jgi:Protein NO VEIN, C-terminal
VSGAFLEGKRRGKLKASTKTTLKDPKRRTGSSTAPKRPRSGQRHYTDRDREDLAFDIVEAVLTETRGVHLDDIRHDASAGADAVDRDKGIWVELKTHGREPADSVRLEPAEAQRAHDARGRYWLVIVWNLEKPRTPEFVVIPDPLHRLDTYLARGLRISGVSELAVQSRGD